MKELKLFIVDDEKKIRNLIKNILELNFPLASIVGEADNVQEAVKLIQTISPDVILLDIQIIGGTGLEVLKQLKPYNFKVIFITAFDQFAVQAFKFSATDYIVKPIVASELIDALTKVSTQLSEEDHTLKLEALLDNITSLKKDSKRIVLNSNEKTDVVPVSDIVKCEAEGNYTRFILVSKKPILVCKPIKEYEDMLTPFSFFRSHNSCLINLFHVDHVDKKNYKLVMKDGTESLVSNRRLPELITALNRL